VRGSPGLLDLYHTETPAYLAGAQKAVIGTAEPTEEVSETAARLLPARRVRVWLAGIIEV
jgi:hypothetical protein